MSYNELIVRYWSMSYYNKYSEHCKQMFFISGGKLSNVKMYDSL